MNFKKISAMLAAAAVCCFSLITVCAEETSDSQAETEAVTEEADYTESEEMTSEDGVWSYTIITDNQTGDSYASVSRYNGEDTEITIPDSIDDNVVKKLGDYAFYENTSVTKFIISKEITDFGDFPFFGCESLREFEVDDENETYTTTDKGALITKDGKLFISCPPVSATAEYTVPDGVEALNPSAFAVCGNIKKINLPDSLLRINLYCFAECTSLDNVVIPDGVSELGMFAFTGCTSLKNITLPQKMHTIDSGAFFHCTSLNSIEFPEYLVEIGQAAFVSTGFTEIELPATIQEIGYSAFGYTADEEGQLVPMSSFTVKGLTGSAAQLYCSENENVSFEAVDPPETTPAPENVDSDADSSGLSTITIICICAGGAILVIALISVIIIVRKRKRSAPSEDEYEEETDGESEATENGNEGE